jgi:hypothetical protein
MTTKTFRDNSFGKCSSRSSEIQLEESWPPASPGICLIDEKISEAKKGRKQQRRVIRLA